MLNAAAKRKATSKKIVIYGCDSNQKCYETTRHAGVMVNALLQGVTKEAGKPITVAQLRKHVKDGVKQNIDQKKYPQTPEFQCFGVDQKKDDFKAQLQKVKHVLIIAANAEGMPKLDGIPRETDDICKHILPLCHPSVQTSILSDDDELIYRLPNCPADVRTPYPSGLENELSDISVNKGGSLVVTLCHAKRVPDESEDDGFSCNLHIGNRVVPDSLLTKAISDFEGDTFIGIFEHCYAKELGDQGFAKTVARSVTTVRNNRLSGKTHLFWSAVGAMLKYCAPLIGGACSPVILQILCMVVPMIVLLATAVFSKYSCILAQVMLPSIAYVIIMLMGGGYISGSQIALIAPIVLGSLLCTGIVAVCQMKEDRNRMRYRGKMASYIFNGVSLLTAGQVARDGIYTDIAVNISAMATFRNGFSVLYQPMNSSLGYECIVPTSIQNKKLVLTVLRNETYFTTVTNGGLATCNHTIFRKEVMRRMNLSAASNSEFGELSSFSIGNITLNMSEYDESKRKYMLGAGLYAKNAATASDAELAQMLEDMQTRAPKDTRASLYIQRGVWTEPEESWWGKLYNSRGFYYFSRYLPTTDKVLEFFFEYVL